MPSKLPQLHVRLSDADLVALGRIREHYGLPSDAAAIRYAVQRQAEILKVQRPNPDKPK